jgi:hypothetical protein
MITEELVSYIKQARASKIPDETISSNLLSSGWNKADVELTMQQENLVPIPRPPSSSNPKAEGVQGSSMWDAFEHILMFLSLYILVTSIALTLYFYVDKWIPGTSQTSYGYDLATSSYGLPLLRGYLASLIVSYPFFAFLFLRVTKRTQKHPEMRHLKVRRQLIYFTLIVTFLIVMINVISIIYGFLNGNVTVNFILHFIITIGISGIIFGYYLNQVKEDRKYYA